MRVLVLSSAVFFAYCAPAKPTPQPPPSSPPTTSASASAPAQWSATKLCERVAQLNKDAAPSDECVLRLETEKQKRPAAFDCYNACVQSAAAPIDLDECNDRCLAPHWTPPADPDAEAMQMLERLETASKNQFQQESDVGTEASGPYFVHHFCPSSAAPVPLGLPVAPARIAVKFRDFYTPAWKCLHVAVNDSLANQYSYTSTGTGLDARFEATARRKLANGKTRVHRLVGKGTSSGDAARESLTVHDD